MATHSKNSRVYLQGSRISEDLKSAGLDQNIDTDEVSTFGDDSKEYIQGKDDAVMSVEGVFNSTTDAGIDKILSDAKAQEAILCFYPNKTEAGKIGYGMKSRRTAYNIMSGTDGAVKFSHASQGSGGAERMVSIADQQAISADGSTTSYDTTSGGSNGGTIYFNCPVFSGTSVSVKIEDSDNDADWADLQALAAVTAVGAQRVEISGTIRRYVRVTFADISGESLTIQCGLHIN